MRILVSRTDVLGDAVVTSAFIQSLSNCFPDASLDILCHHQNYPAFKYHPLVNSIYLLNHQQGSRQLATNYQQLISEINSNGSYDFILQLNGCIRSYKYLQKINGRVIYARKLLTKSVRSRLWMLGNKAFGRFRFFTEDVFQHEVIRLHQFLAFVQLSEANRCTYRVPDYAFFYPSANYQRPDIISGSIVINISGKKDFSRYINDNLLYTLLSRLPANGYDKISVIVMPEDMDRVSLIISDLSLDARVDVVCNGDIYQLALILARHEYFISADGGLVHIAAGLGLKCITLFDRQDSKIWHAWSPLQISLQSPARNIYDLGYRDILTGLHTLK